MGLRKWLRRRKPRIEDLGTGNVFRNVPSTVSIRCCGDNNIIEFPKNTPQMFLDIVIGVPESPANGCEIRIGEGTGIAGSFLMVMESGSVFIVGSDCQIAAETEFWLTDAHAIHDLQGHLLNRGREIRLGNHVWLSKRVVVMKNTIIPDGCVVGYGAVVSRVKDVSKNCILAGNPARVVKSGIVWDHRRPEQYLREEWGE